MINSVDDKCTGCTLCESVCPVQAITFEIHNGFRYPTVDKDKCINCGLCEQKCPSLNDVGSDNIKSNTHVYAAWTIDNEQRRTSTSGGICFELSRYILENGGCVAGVAWTEDYRDARYELITSLDDLHRITQTKYFQPQMGDIYKQIKDKLDENGKVLFIGSACSNAALKSFLGKSYEKLYCCDFICRGYTSQIYHEKRVEYLEKENNSKVKGIQYKNKDKGWTHFGTKFTFENGKEFYVNRADDSYELMFKVNDLNTRPSCYDCKYRSMPRATDITVGDFWGIQGVSEQGLRDGISAVFTYNSKGAKLFDAIKDRIEFEERSVEEVSRGNYALLHNIKRPKTDPKVLFEDLANLDFKEIKMKYGSKSIIKKRKVKGILATLKKCNPFTFISLNYFNKGVVRKKRKYIFPYYGTRVEIQKGGKLIVNENLLVNKPKHKYSNEQTYIRVMHGGVFEVNGKTNIAANATVEVLSDAELRIGSVETNYGVTIICSNKIIMGNGVDIGRNAMVYDSNYHPTSINKNVKLKPLIIKDHVWICSGVTITKGITIEEGAVCGINSTVSRNVKSKHLVMGNPAKSFMSNIEW